ncbi:hypothetical protein [Acidicapsa ligni]|uniref:hypothetical protein n=1 Tax=Acidicapsa ligni TaxID=542300 RepID=UPI0021E01CCD|nr:hypothetical protein [Acidicapsa ligni]
MTLSACKFTPEIKVQLEAGHWPHASSPELQAHAKTCRTCGDLVVVTNAFQAAKAITLSEAKLPPPGILWWRAQLRRRNAAEAAINRPLLGAQIFALVICIAAFSLLLETLADHSQQWARSFSSFSQHFDISRVFNFSSLSFDSGSLTTVIPGIALLALLTGVALYFATEKQRP